MSNICIKEYNFVCVLNIISSNNLLTYAFVFKWLVVFKTWEMFSLRIISAFYLLNSCSAYSVFLGKY